MKITLTLCLVALSFGLAVSDDEKPAKTKVRLIRIPKKVFSVINCTTQKHLLSIAPVISRTRAMNANFSQFYEKFWAFPSFARSLINCNQQKNSLFPRNINDYTREIRRVPYKIVFIASCYQRYAFSESQRKPTQPCNIIDSSLFHFF